MSWGNVGVIDIGKTNAKFAVVDSAHLREVAVRTRPNTVIERPPYPHFDIEGIWSFLKGAIAELNHAHPLDAITITTHGATAALVDESGALALPVLDYEHEGPEGDRADYDALCPPFAHTLTPKLPLGLNLGAQLFHQQRHWPEAFARAEAILTYPQYWAYRLTGVPASELSSLGCHTGLWDFERADFSDLVVRLGIAERFPPVRSAFDALGVVLPELAHAMGLPADLPVHCGIHDSNASLLPHVLAETPPFSVVSTGTWVIVCAPGGATADLDPARDCLGNIDALGRTVPSARFMGGREFSLLTDGRGGDPDAETVARVLDEAMTLLPAIQKGSGPYPDAQAHWSVGPETLDASTRYTIVSFYLALMTAQCLALTHAAGPIIVEGPFARNAPYLNMLGAATRRPVMANSRNATGTSLGAALLTMGRESHPELGLTSPPAPPDLAAMQRYAKDWRAALSSHTSTS